MNDPVQEVIRKINRLRTNHSDDDIITAMRRLLQDGFPEIRSGSRSHYGKQKKSNPRKEKPFSEGVSRSVLELQSEEPEKFEVLSRFDRLVRKREILKDVRSLREFGQSLDKSFDAGKSRKDAVPRIAQLLKDMPLYRLTPVIESTLEKEQRKDESDNDYQQLANFLMSKRRR